MTRFALINLTERNVAAFRGHFTPGGPDECWPWLGFRDSLGYGRFATHKQGWFASRVAWFLANGNQQPEGFVCHSCDNPPCVNPAHLWLGDARSNTRDMIAKRRGNAQKKTHCKSGHPFSPENTLVRGPHRFCRTCRRIRDQRRYQLRKASA